MTIEELKAEWEEWSKSDAAKYSGHLKRPAELFAERYADKLLAIAELTEQHLIAGCIEQSEDRPLSEALYDLLGDR